MSKIAPCLWFDSNAEEAAKFYLSVFKKSKLLKITRYPGVGQEVHGRPEGSVCTVELDLGGQRYTLLNGGPMFKFNEAVSFQVMCKDQKEVDYYWHKLVQGGGQHSQCGWLKDRFGVSWQVTPDFMPWTDGKKDGTFDADVFAAMLTMQKLDIKRLKAAAKKKRR